MARVSAQTAPVRERRRLVRVAVTGHRPNRIAAHEWKRIDLEIGRIFDVLEAAAVKFSTRPLSFVLHTALAEGADRNAAELAARRGWAIDVFLPFRAHRYKRDFRGAFSVAAFEKLLQQAREISHEPGERLERAAGSAAAYAAVGDSLTDRADVLVCVWNGLPPAGPGGTSEVAANMLAKGGLVLWVNAERAGVRLIGPAPLPRAGCFRRNLHEALSLKFERIARPPEMRVA